MPQTGGQFHWMQVRPGVHSSVVAASSGGTTRFFSAEWGQGATPSKVAHSDDGGATWTTTGRISRVPTSGALHSLTTRQSKSTLCFRHDCPRSASGRLWPRWRDTGVESSQRRAERAARWPRKLRSNDRCRSDRCKPDLPRRRSNGYAAMGRIDLALLHPTQRLRL